MHANSSSSAVSVCKRFWPVVRVRVIQPEISHQLSSIGTRINVVKRVTDVVVGEHHGVSPNDVEECGRNSILYGQQLLVKACFRTREANSQHPGLIAKLDLGAPYQPVYIRAILFVKSGTDGDSDAVTKSAPVHQVHVVDPRVTSESRKADVIGCQAQLATALQRDADEVSAERAGHGLRDTRVACTTTEIGKGHRDHRGSDLD